MNRHMYRIWDEVIQKYRRDVIVTSRGKFIVMNCGWQCKEFVKEDFTGFCDQEKKLIYEGDIGVETNEFVKHRIFRIVYHEGLKRLVAKTKDGILQYIPSGEGVFFDKYS